MSAVHATVVPWLGCVVCGDDSEFIELAQVDHLDETELMCTRCGQARLVPLLGVIEVARSA